MDFSAWRMEPCLGLNGNGIAQGYQSNANLLLTRLIRYVNILHLVHSGVNYIENNTTDAHCRSRPLIWIIKTVFVGYGYQFFNHSGGSAFVAPPPQCGGIHNDGWETNTHTQSKTPFWSIQLSGLDWGWVLVALFPGRTKCSLINRVNSIADCLTYSNDLRIMFVWRAPPRTQQWNSHDNWSQGLWNIRPHWHSCIYLAFCVFHHAIWDAPVFQSTFFRFRLWGIIFNFHSYISRASFSSHTKTIYITKDKTKIHWNVTSSRQPQDGSKNVPLRNICP